MITHTVINGNGKESNIHTVICISYSITLSILRFNSQLDLVNNQGPQPSGDEGIGSDQRGGTSPMDSMCAHAYYTCPL